MLPAEALAAKLSGMPEALYAVIDGAHFQDAPAALGKASIPVRSLFLEHQDRSAIPTGPFLAHLDGGKLARLLAINRIEEACVFWGGDVPEPVLFRHLRTINLAQIPRPAEGGLEPPSTTETVLFRHWDPSVMSMMLPVLEPAQRSRVFGPMKSITLFDTASSQALKATARPDGPPPERGFLSLSQAQMEQVSEEMMTRSRRQIASFLRQAAPIQTSGMKDETLLRGIRESEASARTLGIRTQRGIGQWAYLMLISKGHLNNERSVTDFIRSSSRSPDKSVEMILSGIAYKLNSLA